jgi:hypothetical protein
MLDSFFLKYPRLLSAAIPKARNPKENGFALKFQENCKA